VDASLNNARILITRPEHQAHNLFNEIVKLQGKPILFPTIAIAEVEDKTPLYAIMKKLSDFELAIFISANAVTKTICLLQECKQQWPNKTKIAAIGQSTANILQEFNLPVTIAPQYEFNSEGLLALSALQQVMKKNIIIFKGEGGRDLLTKVLAERGARIVEANVYRRVPPKASIKSMDDFDIIICTSNMGLQNLYQMIDANQRPILLNKQLVIVSERMIALAQHLGFVKPPCVADNASDTAIIAALLRFLGEKTLW